MRSLIIRSSRTIRSVPSPTRHAKQWRKNCAEIGLIVTPDKLRVYKDHYLSNSLDSVRLVAQFDISKVLRFRSQEPQVEEREFLFEQRVQKWLERLATNLDMSEYEPSLQE